MKKIHLILIGGAISTLMLTQSCQQPEADQAAVDAKVTEMYNAEKMKVENEAATACEDAISAQVKLVQDSLSHLSAKAQADLLAKTQRELKAAQMKADAVKKKAVNAMKKKVEKVTTKPTSSTNTQRLGTNENAIEKSTNASRAGTTENVEKVEKSTNTSRSGAE